jgi:hypothetical protein
VFPINTAPSRAYVYHYHSVPMPSDAISLRRSRV